MEFLFATIYVLIAAAVTAHVLLTKSDVRAALGWIAVAWLSPLFGGFLYYVFGINRVTRRALHLASPSRKADGAAGSRRAARRAREYLRASPPPASA